MILQWWRGVTGWGPLLYWTVCLGLTNYIRRLSQCLDWTTLFLCRSIDVTAQLVSSEVKVTSSSAARTKSQRASAQLHHDYFSATIGRKDMDSHGAVKEQMDKKNFIPKWDLSSGSNEQHGPHSGVPLFGSTIDAVKITWWPIHFFSSILTLSCASFTVFKNANQDHFAPKVWSRCDGTCWPCSFWFTKYIFLRVLFVRRMSYWCFQDHRHHRCCLTLHHSPLRGHSSHHIRDIVVIYVFNYLLRSPKDVVKSEVALDEETFSHSVRFQTEAQLKHW